MRTAIFSILALCLLLPMNAYGDDLKQHEEKMQEFVKHFGALADALDSVKDAETAKVAAKKIVKSSESLEKLAEKVSKLPKLGEADKKKLETKYMPKIKKIAERMQKVAVQAGFNSGGEPTFIAAMKRMETMGRKLQQIEKDKKEKKD